MNRALEHNNVRPYHHRHTAQRRVVNRPVADSRVWRTSTPCRQRAVAARGSPLPANAQQTSVQLLWVEAGRACFTFLVSSGALAATILLALWYVAAMQGADPWQVLP